MSTEIPFSVTAFCTRDLALASACLSDSNVPRLSPDQMQVIVEGESRFFAFTFPDHPSVEHTFAVWKQAQSGDFSDKSHVVNMFKAFRYWNMFTDIIGSGRVMNRPTQPADTVWTVNTKIPCTALALLDGPLVDASRLSRMVYRDGSNCGFFVRRSEVVEAYEDPVGWSAKHPEDKLSYVMAALYNRDHLRDMVKKLPAVHKFVDANENIHFITEKPKQPPKGDSK